MKNILSLLMIFGIATSNAQELEKIIMEDVDTHDLYLNDIVDGYAPKIPPAGTAKVMLDLVDSPSFLLFVAKYGAPSFRDLDKETLCLLAQHEILMKTGLNLLFGDRPLVPALPIFIPLYF